MNAQTLIALTEQDTLGRMARNRASNRRPVMRDAVPENPDPLNRGAFRLEALSQAVTDARDELDRGKCNVRLAIGRPAKDKARRACAKLSRALGAAEHALVLEEKGAEMADTVMRTDQVQRGGHMDGVVLREASVIVTVRGRIEQMTALSRLLKYHSIDARQYAAGVRYRAAWEAAGLDQFPIGMIGDGGRSAPSSGNHRVENAAGSSALLDRMRRLVGPNATNLLDAVIIQGRDVRGWAASQVTDTRTGLDPSVAIGRLQMALDVLAGCD